MAKEVTVNNGPATPLPTAQPDSPPTPSDLSAIQASLAQDPTAQQSVNDAVQQPVANPTLAPPARQNLPGIVGLIANMIKPPMVAGPGELARPQSRMDAFENFLSNFLGALGQGVSNAGAGPESFSRGFGGAFNAGYIQEQRRAQLAEQAAQTAETNARAGQIQAQTRLLGSSVPLTLPNGQQIFVPASQIGQYLKGGYAANVNAQAKLTAEQLKAQIESGQVARVLPGQDAGGNLVMNAYDKQGRLLGAVPGALPPSSYLPTASSTTQYMQDANGNIVGVPKSSTTSKVPPALASKVPALATAPGSAPAASASSTPQVPRSGFPRPGSPGARGIQAKPVMGPDGQPLQGKGGNSPVYAFDPNGNRTILTTQSDASTRGLQAIRPVKETDIRNDMHDTRVLNDVALKANAVIRSSDALDQSGDQEAIIANALSAAEKDNQFALGISHTTVPTAWLNKLLDAEGVNGTAAATQKTRDYLVAVLSLREAAMGLQKVLTGSARSNEQQIQALQATIPGVEPDSRLAIQKLQAFTQNLDMLRQGLPELPGVTTVPIQFSAPKQQPQQQPTLPNGKYSSMFLR